jgi:hypothetical protein
MPEKRPSRGRPATEPANLPKLLGSLLDSTRVATARAARGSPIESEIWRRVVGDRIAGRTAPGRLSRGVLRVEVSSAVWAQELSFLTEEIAARLRQAGFEVDSIRFAVRRFEPQAATQAAAPRSAPRPVQLPGDLAARLDRVSDPELRAAIAEAAALSLAVQDRDATSGRPGARGPRSAAPRSAPPVRSAPGSRGAPPRRRGGP